MRTTKIAVEIIAGKNTSEAYRIFDGDKYHWIPRSQILSEEILKNGISTLEIPEWLALKKGLI